jgi:hypothetical protein
MSFKLPLSVLRIIIISSYHIIITLYDFVNDKTWGNSTVYDCTGTIVGAYFDHQETLKGYYNVLYQVLNEYGIPNMFYTDNRTVFEYKNKKMKDVGKDTFTQFTYACKQLGVEVKTTSIAQAKERVERMFQTLLNTTFPKHVSYK